MRMTHQNVKQIALALQRKGFLEIETDAGDRRVRRLRLTEHHHRFWRQRNPTDFASVEAWTAGLSDAQAAQAVRLLARLRAHLHALQAPGP
jgi:DNA-binding MarR family transcriptional regulator